MAATFPYGYSSPMTMLTWDQMMAKTTVRNLHPEVRRRLKALIEFAATEGVPLGVGTGWRVQPDPPPPGFAQPGNSWHESCPVSPQSATALAIDTVPASSWTWMEANCAAFGFRTFRNVNNEPWHIQPVEVPTSRRFATTLPPLQVWPLPGPPDQPNVPPPAEEDDVTYLHLVSPGQPEAIVALDGAGATFVGLSSIPDRDVVVAAYGAKTVALSAEQYAEFVRVAREP